MSAWMASLQFFCVSFTEASQHFLSFKPWKNHTGSFPWPMNEVHNHLLEKHEQATHKIEEKLLLKALWDLIDLITNKLHDTASRCILCLCPSLSKASMSSQWKLASIHLWLVFYTDLAAQCLSLFRSSALGLPFAICSISLTVENLLGIFLQSEMQFSQHVAKRENTFSGSHKHQQGTAQRKGEESKTI